MIIEHIIEWFKFDWEYNMYVDISDIYKLLGQIPKATEILINAKNVIHQIQKNKDEKEVLLHKIAGLLSTLKK